MNKRQYHFVRCQTHPRCPNLIGWFLQVESGDEELIQKLHKGVSSVYYWRFGVNPHVQKDELRRKLYNVPKLGGLWLEGIDKLFDSGGPVLVNSNGGMLPRSDVIVISEHDEESMIWPDQYEDETIKISRWPRGKHYYLVSNRSRVIVPEKFRSYKEAEAVALRYVPRERIVSRE